MRRILIPLLIVAVCAAVLMALWIFRGREISSFVDRYWTVETESTAIRSIAYEGSGTGGILTINDVSLSLNDMKPGISLSVGSTKDNQLALASGGKVFAFGTLPSTAEESGDHLTAVAAAGDQAFLATRHSVLSWPTPFDLNFMTGQSPSWKRHIYYELSWKKVSGADLKMLWCYEQFFYRSNGWASEFMTREDSTGLIRVEINESRLSSRQMIRRLAERSLLGGRQLVSGQLRCIISLCAFCKNSKNFLLATQRKACGSTRAARHIR